MPVWKYFFKSSFFVLSLNAIAQNPIIPNQSVCDPAIRIFNNTAYLYATHDYSMKNNQFVMKDWWLWSSKDLVNWKLESSLKPYETYLDSSFSKCWATDAAFSNGKYYWYFSAGNKATGVVVSNYPTGPWKDTLNKPFLNSSLTESSEYDPALFKDFNSAQYIIFGVWDFYIAKLNPDMLSLNEKPQKIIITGQRGPYNLDGNNLKHPSDDKVYLHKHKNIYYLSWGCFYAISKKLYGPYNFVGSIIQEENIDPFFKKPVWSQGLQMDRHGCFFSFNNQDYFAFNDASQTGNRYFRNTCISYVHYKDNGQIAPVVLDKNGVGLYDLNYKNIIEAENYFNSNGFIKQELKHGGFGVLSTTKLSSLTFPNIKNVKDKTILTMRAKVNKPSTLILKTGFPDSNTIGTLNLSPSDTLNDYQMFLSGDAFEHLYLELQSQNSGITIDYLRFD